MLAYFPANLNRATLDLQKLGARIAYQWINPSTGDSTQTHTAGFPLLTVQKPDDNDWLFVARSLETPLDVPQKQDAPFFLDGIAPHPFLGETDLLLTLLERGSVTVTVWDLLGRRILETRQTAGVGFHKIPLRIRQAGTYVYRVAYTTSSNQSYQATGTMVCLGGSGSPAGTFKR